MNLRKEQASPSTTNQNNLQQSNDKDQYRHEGIAPNRDLWERATSKFPHIGHALLPLLLLLLLQSAVYFRYTAETAQ